MTTISWFESYWAGMKAEVGGKAASLGEMTGAGLPVPPGFAICTSAYRRARDESDLDAQIARILHGMDIDDTDSVTERCGQIRRLIADDADPRGHRAADPRRLPRARRARRGQGRPRRGAVVGDLGGLAGRLVRRGARHLPLGPRRGGRHRRRAPLLGEPVHRPRDVLPRRDGLRPPRGRDVRGRPEDGAAQGGRRRLHPQPDRRRPLAGRHRLRLGLRRGGRVRRGDARQLPRRQGDEGDRATHHLGQGVRVPALRPRHGGEGAARPGPGRRPEPHRRRDPGDRHARPDGGAPLRLPAGHRVGRRRRPARRAERDPAAGPSRDGLEQEGPEREPRRRNGDFMASIVSTLMSPLYSKDRTTTPEVLHDHDHAHVDDHDHTHDSSTSR